MQIMGGGARGIRLKVAQQTEVRPATGALREAIFSHLGPGIAGLRFADLFAGSGSYGLEAISRGAGPGIFIDDSALACRAIRDNLERVCRSMNLSPDRHAVRRDDAFHFRGLVDLIFLDPPYRLVREGQAACFALIVQNLKRSELARAIFEMPSDCLPKIPDGLECLRILGRAAGGNNRPKALVLKWKSARPL